MASNDEDDAVVGEESVGPRRTRSGRPVATARRGRGRKKTSSPRAPRATRNTRAKQQMDDDDDEEEEVLEGGFADCDTTEPGSAHGSSGDQEHGSPAQREEATSSSDGGCDKIQYLVEEDDSRATPEATEDVDLVSTNGMIDNEAEAVADETSQGVPSSPEAEESVPPVDNGFEVEDQKSVESNSYGVVEISHSLEEVPELEASPPPSVTGSVTSTIQSSLRQRSVDPLEEDSQSQETLAGLNQLKEAVEELNGLVQPGTMEVEEIAPAVVVSEVVCVEDEPMETDREAEVKEETREAQVDLDSTMKEAQVDMDTTTKELEATIDTTTKEPEVKTSSTEEAQTAEPDTEMVSEDELPTESKEPLETEAVSDEELPDPAGPGPENLPETEEVSEDELPPEKSYKKKSKAKQKSQDKTVTGSESTNSSKKKKKSRDSQKRKMLVGDSYDPSSPTSENSMDAPPAAKKAAMATDGEETSKSSASKAQAQQRKTLPELEKYWKAVKEDPSDFTGWTYLLQYVDQENDIDAAREAYDSFLSHYPYCYGYWRKYADYEKRKANKDKCEEVFQRGLKAIPLSVDLWIHYLNYCKTINADNEDLLREQFEKAIEACGLEFRSDRLWESYIKWEAEGKRLQRVTAIYDRLLATPTQSYISHFESFTALVNTHSPQKLLSVDEFLTERREVLQQLKQYEQPKPVVDPAGPPGEEGDAPPGEEGEEKAQVQRNDEETTALREKIIANRRKIHKATVTAVSDRWVFEEAIKRPYFHVKPLERCQLKNWREYLDYEVAQGDRARIVVLFERCLIACALYEDLWLKFIRYLENLNEDELTEKIRDVYERACTIHHTKKPSLHLYWAVFEETHQNYEKASEILVSLEKIVPNMLQVAYRRINLERRRGRLDQVCTLYDHYINTAKNKLIANNMAVKYARFCLKVKNDMDTAISILNSAIDKDKENPRLHLQLLDTNLQRSPVDEAEVIASIDKFLENNDADVDQKVMFAQRKVEFLEDFGSSVQSVQSAQDEFTRYCKLAKEKKKKLADEAKGESKKSKAAPAASSGDSPSAPAPTSASPVPAAAPPQYPPSQYPAGYSGAPAPPYQGQYPPAGQQPPYQYNQQYNQSDPNYANYQNWGYSQTGYGGYNQGWTGNYNYY